MPRGYRALPECIIDFAMIEESTDIFVNDNGRLEQCLLRTPTIVVAPDRQSVTVSIRQEINPDGAADPGCIAAAARPVNVSIFLECLPPGC